MLCSVEQDLNSFMKNIDSSNNSYKYWKWCFEGELKFLKKSISHGSVKLKDMDEVKECIDTLFEESNSFEYKDQTYDFSEELQNLLDNF